MFGMLVRLESVDGGTYSVALAAFLDNFDGDENVVVTPAAVYECRANVDLSDGLQRFTVFCADRGYTGLRLTLNGAPLP